MTHDQRGTLRLGGDWACAHGDFAALREVARRLAEGENQPLLGQIARACIRDPERACLLWQRYRATTSESNSVPSASIA